ncbi:SufE family protein [Aestuariispira insulae]|uniref:Cysteine desulfuration protein SufE n=1 Tax=Aestuariispira insulae TaxID=1461337 RepID=A0A3D9HJR2_9PROT|nr:SufE family protein [Aestuariispira insulae]RED49708.1 cysteine desulfuration protein SufE [Aestuariispira insulae]
MAIDLEELVEDFSFFDDWEARYSYIIDLGKKLPPMPAEEMIEENKVRGCMSQVWMTSRVEGDPAIMRFNADSDAFIVKGLIAVLMQIYDGQSPADIAETDAMEALSRIGLESHISPNRRNGLVAMVERIRADAAAQLG